MSAIGAFLVLGTALPITAAATRRLHERWRARWHLRDYVDLASAREGDRVFVSGIVRALDETLVAPLSGKTCVGYRARARGASTAGRGSTPWQETMQMRPFAIERDDGERIVVDGDRAIFGVAAQKLVPRMPDRETSFLARHAIARAKGRAQLTEVLIEVGARIRVGGTLVLVPRESPPSGELGFRDPPPPEPQIAGNRDAPLVIVSAAR